MVLRMMSEVMRLGKFMEGSGCARGAEEKVVEEGGELSGRHGQTSSRPTGRRPKALSTQAGCDPSNKDEAAYKVPGGGLSSIPVLVPLIFGSWQARHGQGR